MKTKNRCVPPLIHPCRDQPHSLFQMTAPSVHALLHNYATNSSLVTTGRPKFTPKSARSPSTIIGHLKHLSLNQPHSPPQTASRSNRPFCHSTLSRHTHTRTHTDRWDRRQVYSNKAYALDSDVFITSSGCVIYNNTNVHKLLHKICTKTILILTT